MKYTPAPRFVDENFLSREIHRREQDIGRQDCADPFPLGAQDDLAGKEREQVARYHAVLDAPLDGPVLDEIGELQVAGKVPGQGVRLAQSDELLHQDAPGNAPDNAFPAIASRLYDDVAVGGIGK